MASAGVVKVQFQRNRADDVLLITDVEFDVRHMQVGVIRKKSEMSWVLPLMCLGSLARFETSSVCNKSVLGSQDLGFSVDGGQKAGHLI